MRFVLTVLVILTYIPAYTQYMTGAEECAANKINIHRRAAKTTVASPEEDKYDVQHVWLDIAMDNQSVAIAGKARTTARVLENNFALYVFELNKLLVIDSILINGQKVDFERQENLVNSFLTAPLHTGATLATTVYYHGMPEAGTVFPLERGLNNAEAGDWGSKVTYTLSEPYNAKDWWPCKQSLRDKIDSADIWITVPDSLVAGSNGTLQGITPMPGNMRRYEWKTTYPTACYLLSAAVADYMDYSYTTQLPGGESLLVQNYVYDRPGIMERFKNGIDSTGEMLYYFSELFGTYPFHNEKYGHCMAPLFGGMEHQTMTTLQHFRYPLVSHELAHQWFGDNVTCATWRDIWINEGFASYAEYLFTERFRPVGDAYNYMLNVHKRILNDTNIGGSIYIPVGDTVNPYRIFDSRLSYQKPSAVLHTLRFLINDDHIFFGILKKFQKRFAGGNAGTEDFKTVAEELSGMDLDTFFAEWIYGEGYPIYDIRWNYISGKLLLVIKQEGSVPSSIPYYHIPMEIKLVSRQGDTTIRLGSSMTQSTYYNIDRTIDDLVFDPRNVILEKTVITRDYSLGTNHASDQPFVYPNPATDA